MIRILIICLLSMSLNANLLERDDVKKFIDMAVEESNLTREEIINYIKYAQPSQKAVELRSNQPEVKATWDSYRSKRVTDTRILNGVNFINENQLCKQFQLNVRRSKNAKQQEPRLFAQADNDHWFKDFYFLLAMLLLFCCSGACSFTKGKISNNYPIFPLFYSKHQKDEEIKAKSKNNKSSSLVSHTYNFLFGRILKRFAFPPKNLIFPKNSKIGRAHV